MRIALVQCPAWGPIPPLSLAALKAYVEEHGHEAACVDLNIDFYNDCVESGAHPLKIWGADAYSQWGLDYNSRKKVRFQKGSRFRKTRLPTAAWMERVLATRPDAVGFTVPLTSFAASLVLARAIKKRVPGMPIIFGGPNVAEDREGITALLSRVPDLVVHGEGEETLREILDTLEAGGDPRSLAGVGCLVNGEPRFNAPRKQIRNLDSLPFSDFSDFPLADYPKANEIPISASRGCVNHCAFCYECVFWKGFRVRSPEKVVAEMEHQLARHPMYGAGARRQETPHPFFTFADSLVNGHPKNLARMCDLIVEKGLDIHWGGQATLDPRMDEAFCEKLVKAGCLGLAMGLESGSQDVLDSMGKTFKIDEAGPILRTMHQAGLPATVNVMVGFPTETLRDFAKTLRFLYENRAWIFMVNNVTTTQLALGSRLFTHPEEFGVKVQKDGDWWSRPTGRGKHRWRRLRFLHRAMSLLKVGHQKMAR